MSTQLQKRLQALEGATKHGPAASHMVMEYESAEHLEHTIAQAEARGFKGCVIALPKRTTIESKV